MIVEIEASACCMHDLALLIGWWLDDRSHVFRLARSKKIGGSKIISLIH
jgi:hypothetical protein